MKKTKQEKNRLFVLTKKLELVVLRQSDPKCRALDSYITEAGPMEINQGVGYLMRKLGYTQQKAFGVIDKLLSARSAK